MIHPQAHLDAAAQQIGFRDYATWAAWNAHRQDVLSQNPTDSGAPVAQAPQPQAAPQNWLQNLIQQYTPLGGAMKSAGKVF